MKIKSLDFTAFGPFTDKLLNFSSSGQEEGGLHIIYGSNEAGKSSALRGLKALLYGIDARSPDNFVHDHKKLRIKGCLKTNNGKELEFVRRKGNKNTLLDPEGELLDEQVLTPYLQGVTADFFNSLFGIDHQALLKGGKEILKQKGEVGQALFSAGLGSSSLHSVLKQFDDEAEALFLPRGSKQTINSALKSYAELKREITSHSLSSKEWHEQQSALVKTTGELEQIQLQLAANRSEINRLQRFQRVLPKLARRRELLEELKTLADVVILSDDFSRRHQQAVNGLETAQTVIGKTSPRFKTLQEQLDSLSVRQEVLEQAENIEDLHTRLGSYRKALQDRPNLQAEWQQRQTDISSLLKDIRPDLELEDLEKLRPLISKRQSIIELGNKNTLLVSQADQVENNHRETEVQLKNLLKERSSIPESGSSQALQRSIISARRLGDIDTAIQSQQSELTALQALCDAELSRLTLWEGKLDELPGLAIPNRESITRVEKSYDDLDKRFELLGEKQEAAVDSLYDTSQRLDKFQRMGDVPTEKELLELRSNRDDVWKLLRRQWLGGEDISEEAGRITTEVVLPDAFEQRVVDADELSDRLRREADRVHELASLQAKEQSTQQQADDISRMFESYKAEKKQLDTQWQSLWSSCKIFPQSPREMRVWLEHLATLRQRVEQLNGLRQEISELERNRKTHIESLNHALEQLGKECSNSKVLESVLSECESTVQLMDRAKQKQDLLDKDIKKLKMNFDSLSDESKKAKQELEAWDLQWQALIESLELQEKISPSEMSDIIEKTRDLFVKQNEAEKLQIRIQAIDNDAESFRILVTDMVSSLLPELSDLSAADAVIRLNSLLNDNRSKQTQCQQIKEQLELAGSEIQDSRAVIQTMTDRLDSLCSEAKCERHADLEESERKSADYLKIKMSLDTVEQEILETGEGASIARLEMEAEGIDPDSLPVKIAALKNKNNDELEPKRTNLAEAKGRKEKELELMDGSDAAAALADQAQAILTGIRANADNYVRAKLAGRVLRSEIERYRKENQGPLIKRASEHFSALTLGSFTELMTDFNEADEPVLTGIRADGDHVYVEGMSAGTRDQLYLALRLASLEKYMESNEPMPFIVDDILVDFDDHRSEAALNALAVLSEKTQIILFTHHSKCVEQAKKLQSKAHLEIHEL